MPEPLTIVVSGVMGQNPFAGVVWQVLHYLEGFRRLGHEVFYVEDTGAWPFDPDRNAVSGDCDYAVRHIARTMELCGLPGRWAYVAAPEGRRVFGLTEAGLSALYQRAKVLVNLTGSTSLHGDQMRVPVRIYLETDPTLPQIEVALGSPRTMALLSAHTHFFTFGENIGKPGCGVPSGPFPYRPTRQPVVLDRWPFTPSGSRRFTTIGNWHQSGKDVEWNGEMYTWSKHHEFKKFLELPRRSGFEFELALGSIDADGVRLLNSHGWRIADGPALSRDVLQYRDYILASGAEFTVAKDQNVRLRSGWFSDRSACYLAAGRPVVTQDTGFGSALPAGCGLFAFTTLESAAAACEAIHGDYERHSRAARAIAEEYFRAETVLAALLADLGE